jgi:hypothetical protein
MTDIDELIVRAEQVARKARELRAAREAKRIGKPVSYIDGDGCEIMVTTDGHVFYNVTDWW